MVTPRQPIRDPEKEKVQMRLVPMGRRGGVDDIANALVFFMSDMSSYDQFDRIRIQG